MIFWLAFIGCVVFAFLVGLVFGYHMRQNTKVGTPSASHNKQGARCIKCGYPLNAKGQCLNGVCDLYGV